jgi:FixJ family two-component response regulator
MRSVSGPGTKQVGNAQGQQPMMPKERVVFVIDDDNAVRHSICMLLESYGIVARPYPSAAAFLADSPAAHGCLLVDVEMPGMTGLELLDRLQSSGIAMPAIVMTATPTRLVRRSVDRVGATLLQKPFRSSELMSSIETALGRYRAG